VEYAVGRLKEGVEDTTCDDAPEERSQGSLMSRDRVSPPELVHCLREQYAHTERPASVGGFRLITGTLARLTGFHRRRPLSREGEKCCRSSLVTVCLEWNTGDGVPSLREWGPCGATDLCGELAPEHTGLLIFGAPAGA